MKTTNQRLMWNPFRTWLHKRHDAQFARINRQREQSIEILQKRYGYTRAQAAAEFEKHYSKARLG